MSEHDPVDDQRPSVDRAWELMEMAYSEGDVQVVGWSDSSLIGWDTPAVGGEHSEGITFSAYKAVRRSHEDEVLVVAFRVPHPDQQTLAEVLHGCQHRHGTETRTLGEFSATCCVDCGQVDPHADEIGSHKQAT